MLAHTCRPRLLAIALFVALLALADRPAHAQFGFGYGFGMLGMGGVPSPTQYINDASLARVAAYANTPRKRPGSDLRNSPNAYWNNIRDSSGEGSFDINSRWSMRQRMLANSAAATAPAAPTPTAPAVAEVPARSEIQPIEAYFLPDGRVDWPKDAPADGALRSDREALDNALSAVRTQLKTGPAQAKTLAEARLKLITYGQGSLARVRAERSAGIANLYHYFLLFLNDTLTQLAG